jgi:hypothetical protein
VGLLTKALYALGISLFAGEAYAVHQSNRRRELRHQLFEALGDMRRNYLEAVNKIGEDSDFCRQLRYDIWRWFDGDYSHETALEYYRAVVGENPEEE